MLSARSKSGLTQEAVAELMGTTKSAVSRLEAGGKYAPSLTTLRNMLRRLAVAWKQSWFPTPAKKSLYRDRPQAGDRLASAIKRLINRDLVDIGKTGYGCHRSETASFDRSPTIHDDSAIQFRILKSAKSWYANQEGAVPMSTEADARMLIDRLLEMAGWEITNKAQVSTEEASRTGGRTTY